MIYTLLLDGHESTAMHDTSSNPTLKNLIDFSHGYGQSTMHLRSGLLVRLKFV
jgi:hypothetical protein